MTRTALIALAALGLAGSAAAQSHDHSQAAPATATTPAPAASAARPTVASPIKDLLTNAETQAVLEKHLPGVSEHPARAQFEDMTLEEVAPLSDGHITAEIIAAIDADLKKLPAA